MTFVINTAAIHVSDDREDLFEIDGTKYTVPKTVGGEIGLRATKIATEQGELAATMFCVEHTMGMDAYDALCKVEGLPKKILSGILAVCREKVFGEIEEEGKG